MGNANQAFSDEQVRQIKGNLVLGVSLVALARLHGCSTETIGRMKRGLTYRHVVVEGEEKLRPEVRVVGMTPRQLEVVSGVTEEEAEESQRRFLAELAKETANVKAVKEIDADLREQIRRMGLDV